MRKAENGQSFVATWKTQSTVLDTEDDVIVSKRRDEEVVVFHATEDHFHHEGFGAYRLDVNKLPARHPSTASDILLNIAGLELRHKQMKSFIDSLPAKEEVAEAEDFEETLRVLDWLKRERKLTFKKFAQEWDFAERVILPSDDLGYGVMFVPKGKGDLLIRVGYEGQLGLTHDLVDVLETKHRLMDQLGLNNYINLDLKKINNALDYQESRGR